MAPVSFAGMRIATAEKQPPTCYRARMAERTTPLESLRAFIAEQTANQSQERSDDAMLTRLRTVLADHKLADAGALVDALGDRPPRKLVDAVVAAAMNNETSFFRDPHCFDHLAADVLPPLLEERRSSRTLRLWSAACSTGQEPVSLAILLHELLGCRTTDWSISITATDVSPTAVARTKKGRYSTLEIRRGLSDERRAAHFTPDRNAWTLAQPVKKLITAARLNLARPWPAMPPQDVILLRNVLIYMAPETRDDILKRIADSLASDGCLILGAPETLLDSPLFDREVHGRLRVYRPRR